jgi:protoporphyrin/coproporphyrin ferrochelatase
MEKRAVLLLNLGSPDSTSVPDVRRYLREFLMDGRVLDAPYLIRWFIVHLGILPRRPKKSAEAYRSIWTERGSPLLATSADFKEQLAPLVDLPLYLGMRYGNPSTRSQVEQMVADGIEEVLIFPLYPHYAMSSYESALVCATDAIRELAPSMTWEVVQPFYRDPGYIECLIDEARPWLQQDYDHLLFSFHGVPERHMKKGDPSHAHCLSCADCCERAHPAHATCYRHQCLETVRHFVAAAGIPEGKYSVSFQSRLGRDPWLRPYTDLRLQKLPEQGVKKLLVLCPAFVTDCLETLEEIAEEGKELFMEAGGSTFHQIPCLNLNPRWIAWVADLVRSYASKPSKTTPLIPAEAARFGLPAR